MSEKRLGNIYLRLEESLLERIKEMGIAEDRTAGQMARFLIKEALAARQKIPGQSSG